MPTPETDQIKDPASPPHQPAARRRLSYALLAALFTTIAAAAITHQLAGGDWRAVEAKVNTTEIHRTRPGNLAWSLMVDAAYEVNGRPYQYRWLDVFHHQEREVTEAEQTNWPPGRRFTIYYTPENPATPSLDSDGGRQAMTVLAALMTPMALMLLWLVYMLFRKQDKLPAAD